MNSLMKIFIAFINYLNYFLIIRDKPFIVFQLLKLLIFHYLLSRYKQIYF